MPARDRKKALYDVILVDEAQDLSPHFLRLCHLLLDDDKRLIYAYDELQNLSGASLPSPEEIFRAKGNEAGMVYVINAQDCHADARNLATIRNRLFTAITRSKAWIRVLGVGQDMARLIDEYQALKSRGFELQFTYPTKAQRERLRIIHRDRSAQESVGSGIARVWYAISFVTWSRGLPASRTSTRRSSAN